MSFKRISKLLKHYSSTNQLKGHKKNVHYLAWNLSDKLASGSGDLTARIWAPDSSRYVCNLVLEGHENSVDQLCWSPIELDLLATASGDKTVRIWDTRTGKSNCVIPTTGENINITWSPDGKSIAVGNKSDVISFINVEMQKITKNTRFPFEVNEISWDKSGQYFFITTGRGTVEIFRWPSLEKVMVLQAHTSNCFCIDFDPTQQYFAVGSADSLVSLWDLNELICLRTIPRLKWPVRAVSFSYDGKLIASGSEDKFIDISWVENGEFVTSIPLEGGMNSIAWHPNKYILAYAGESYEQGGVIQLYGIFDQYKNKHSNSRSEKK
ncbi:tho complex subunit 3 tho3 [Anaeramoeba ignava]|uniref:Tho complex subunit 3 tho3 n=1 Tax=Anaeramoeba ignava TaxID=1746090 RepID=A0A9Q0RB94_ANAIG|nr:tho complex subunit 3 tho3 [Anaeramoeba ignava]